MEHENAGQIEHLIEEERELEESFTDVNYIESHPKMLPERYLVEGRSIKILRCNCDKNKGTFLVDRIKMMPNVYMSDSFDEVRNDKVRILFVNIGEEDVTLPELKASKYDVPLEKRQNICQTLLTRSVMTKLGFYLLM